MQYVLETNNPICRESGMNVSFIIGKMYIIADHIPYIVDKLVEQYPNDEVFEKYSKAQIVNSISRIVVYMDSANDEFHLESSTGDISIYLEMEDRETAEMNDLDFLQGTDGFDRDKYEIGDGEWSYYTRLYNTHFYFRFM